MCPGEKRHMVIPSEWAWGKRGLEENGVPSHADIIMDVELVTARSETHGDFNMPARVLEIEPTYDMVSISEYMPYTEEILLIRIIIPHFSGPCPNSEIQLPSDFF